MLRVAIVGCGKIADGHAAQIQRINGCEIVGVCDREPLMALQLFERFPVQRHFRELEELLAVARPDVVHVTTPPASHFDIAKTCLEWGCHVYVEKPFTLTASEAEALVSLAQERDLKLTVGHDGQFSPATRRMRELIHSGYLGGYPVQMESFFCYELGQTNARALVGDQRNWIRKLPGKLLHNIISHGIAPIAEFLDTDSPKVVAYGFVSPLLRDLGEKEIIDELRVIISEDGRTSAYFTFSSRMHPSLHQFSIYGPSNGIYLDQDHEIMLKLRGTRYKSYLEFFIPPLVFAQQNLANVIMNAKGFFKRDLHMRSGMRYLIESFYRSIREGCAVPIPYREILRTARIMDCIFEQIRTEGQDNHDFGPESTRDYRASMHHSSV